MPSQQPGWVSWLRLLLRSFSVHLKIAAGLAGILAAVFWYLSAVGEPPMARTYNVMAALTTALSMLCQAINACVDAWVAPKATWG